MKDHTGKKYGEFIVIKFVEKITCKYENSYRYENIWEVPCCGDCNSKKAGITKDMVLKVYKFLYEGNKYASL